MKRYVYYMISMPLTVGISACTVGPDFVKPDPPPDQHYTQEENLTQFGSQHINENKIISETWWTDFSSPELNTVMEYGIQNSLALSEMKENLAQAIEMVNASEGQLWPQLSMNAGAGRQKYGAAFLGPLDFVIPPFTYYEIGPSLTYLVDIFGSTRRSIEKQKALTEYQMHATNAAYLSLTGNIITTALSIATINAQIDVAKDILKEDKENLKLVKVTFEYGSGTKTDVLTAESQLKNDEAILPHLYQKLNTSKNQLNNLVSATPESWKPPHFQLKDFTLPKELPLSLPSELVHHRPDILAAESVLHASNADVGIATANLYPNIMITGSLLQEALTPGQLFKAASTAWSYAANLVQPLFTGGKLTAEQRAAQHAYEASLDNYQQVVIKSFTQVNDVLHALKFDAQGEQLQSEAVKIAKESLRLARLSYNAGEVGLLEVLEANRLYMEARLGYVKAKGQRYQDAVQLYLALGGRSQVEALPKPSPTN